MRKAIYKLRSLTSLWSVRLPAVYLIFFAAISITDDSTAALDDIELMVMLLGPICGFGLGMDTSRMIWSRVSGLLFGFAIAASLIFFVFDYLVAYTRTHAFEEFKSVYLLSYLLVACIIFGLSVVGRFAGILAKQYVSDR